MRAISRWIPVACLLALSSTAHAQITNLPVELEGPPEEQIISRAGNAVSDEFGCNFTEKQIQRLKADYVIQDIEEQDAEDAEYPGEPSSFVLLMTAVLPPQCSQSGTTVCKMRFELYDEKSYSISTGTFSCEQ